VPSTQKSLILVLQALLQIRAVGQGGGGTLEGFI